MNSYRKYFDHIADEVPIVKILYYLAIPFTWIAISFQMTANMVTTISNIFVILSAAALIYCDNPYIFSILFFISILLDLSDGMVARISKTASPNGAFYDYLSDRIKFIIIFLATGLRYHSVWIWITIFSVNSILLFIEFIDRDQKLRKCKLFILNNPEFNKSFDTDDGGMVRKIQSQLKKRNLLKQIKKAVFTLFFALDINTMLFLLILSFGKIYAMIAIIYLGAITFISTISLIKKTIKINSLEIS